MNSHSTNRDVIHPGGTLGVMGGGQLGRMFAMAAARMGYRVIVYAPEANCPAAQVAAEHVRAPYHDSDALERFAKRCDAVTIEFENIPFAALHRVSRLTPTRPGPEVLRTAQNRIAERAFLDRLGLPTAKHVVVHNEGDVAEAARQLAAPFVIKNARLGYDGRGQQRVNDAGQAVDSWRQLGGKPALCEAWVDYRCELSVIVARSSSGEMQTFGPMENRHVDHILDLTSVPAEIPAGTAAASRQLAQRVAEGLALEGVICVELFLTREGELLINELAPRPHNSGHLTIEAAEVSQFEQQVRAVCNLPLGAMTLRRPAAMVNLLGDLWSHGQPDWQPVLDASHAHLHLYGKNAPRPSRKMGHLTVLADTPAQASHTAMILRRATQPAPAWKDAPVEEGYVATMRT